MRGAILWTVAALALIALLVLHALDAGIHPYHVVYAAALGYLIGRFLDLAKESLVERLDELTKRREAP